MTSIQLTNPQRALLAWAAAAQDGFADAFEGEAKIAAGLIRRRLMMHVAGHAGPGRLVALKDHELQVRILEGRQSAGLTLRKMLRSNPPLDWAEQRTWIRQLGSTG
jgi:hypothetical protein